MDRLNEENRTVAAHKLTHHPKVQKLVRLRQHHKEQSAYNSMVAGQASLAKPHKYSKFSIIRTAGYLYNLNTVPISELVRISEQAINLTVLHNCWHD